MPIILVCTLTGGAGATTTCRELAAAAVADGVRVGLIDLDGQGGLTRWWNRRTKDAAGTQEGEMNPALLQIAADTIPTVAAQLRARFGLLIIDSPPSVHTVIRAVAAAADLALIPVRPTVDDLDAVGPIARLLHGVVDFGFVQTQVPGKRSVDGAEALERLAARAAVLGRTTFRAAYSRPAATGSTGFESDPVPKAEIGELYGRIKERLGIGVEPDRAIPESPDHGTVARRVA
jgi:chromosome partitioning protein